MAHPKGHIPWNKGKKGLQVSWNKGTVGVMRAWNKGIPQTEEVKKKISNSKLNNPTKYWLGKKRSKETIEKIREKRFGVKLPESWVRNVMAGLPKKEKHWNWKGGVTKENKKIRRSREWKLWRCDVFERDRYTCKECGAKGVYLEAHHIVPIRSNMNRVFDINNGITLCRPCHIKTMWKESDFAEKYSALVAAH